MCQLVDTYWNAPNETHISRTRTKQSLAASSLSRQSERSQLRTSSKRRTSMKQFLEGKANCQSIMKNAKSDTIKETKQDGPKVMCHVIFERLFFTSRSHFWATTSGPHPVPKLTKVVGKLSFTIWAMWRQSVATKMERPRAMSDWPAGSNAISGHTPVPKQANQNKQNTFEWYRLTVSSPWAGSFGTHDVFSIVKKTKIKSCIESGNNQLYNILGHLDKSDKATNKVNKTQTPLTPP